MLGVTPSATSKEPTRSRTDPIAAAPLVAWRMVRQGQFGLEIRVRGRSLREHHVMNQAVAQAEAGAAFEVAVVNDNRATYLVRLFVDGHEAEPGYTKKLRGDDEALFKGYVCEGRDIHEFLFSKTPVDERADASSSSSASSLGEVRALIYATRRVRLDHTDSESDDGYHRRSSDTLGLQALPEKQAIKELGIQSRAGGAVEHLPRYRRRRRGDYRLEKVKPEVAELRLLYRDSFWLERNRPAPADDHASVRAGGGGSCSCSCSATTSSAGATHGASTRDAAANDAAAVKSEAKWWEQSAAAAKEPMRAPVSAEPVVKAEPMKAPASAANGGARPMARRAPGETARGPDGKRRRKDGGEAGHAEVIELSDSE